MAGLNQIALKVLRCERQGWTRNWNWKDSHMHWFDFSLRVDELLQGRRGHSQAIPRRVRRTSSTWKAPTILVSAASF
jgi:hypothetical protein